MAISLVCWFAGGRPWPRARGIAPLVIMLLGLGHASAGHAEIFRCKSVDGGVLFSDKACADNPMAAKEETTQAPQSKPVPPAAQPAPAAPKPVVRAPAAPVSRSAEARTRTASAAPLAVPRASTPMPAQGADGPTELAELAYLRAIGELCPLPVEHTQVLRFLDMLAIDRLDTQGVRPSAEQMKSIQAGARQHAQRDATSAGQGACADADRRLVALGQTRVQFRVLSAPAK